MNRRRFLELATISTPFIAGCSGQTSESTASRTETPYSTPSKTATARPTRSPTDTYTDTPTETESPTETDTPTETPRENPDTIFIHPDGSSGNPGSKDAPLSSIQEGLRRADPGQTIFVHAGKYRISNSITSVRDGTTDEPITITGPGDAVVRPAADSNRFSSLLRIRHNHIHLRGLSFNGLANPTRAEEIDQYRVKALIRIMPPTNSTDYLKNIVVKPDFIANSFNGAINHVRANNVEIGEFKVVGLAGARYTITENENEHAGEIVYLGTPPSAVLQNVVPKWGIDESHNIHVHHIDNSAGHPHSELVNTKLGTHDVRIEYCTDGGGSQNTESYPPASMNLQSYDATVRWCRLENGTGHGVHVNSGAEGALDEIDDPPITRETAGTGHSIYGNELTGYDEYAIAYTQAVPEEQAVVCGNSIRGPTQGTPTDHCPSDVPTGNGIGHRGGDSPWG